MSDSTIATLFSVGASAWIYAKVYRSSGGNTKGALVVAIGCGIILFILALIIIKNFSPAA